MEIGKLLLEEHGFNDPVVLIKFKCKYGYSGAFISGLLEDK